MATLKAFVKPATDETKSKLRFRLRDGRKIDLYGTSEITIAPSIWDPKQEKIKSRLRSTDKEQIENQITTIKNHILTEYNKVNKTKIDKRWLKEILFQFYHPDSNNTASHKSPSLWEFITTFIENGHLRIDKQGKRLSQENVLQHISTFNHIKKYAATQNRKEFEFDEIDNNFYIGFIRYFQALNFTSNSIGKYIRITKLFINEATKQGLNQNTAYRDFTVFSEEVDNCYLNGEELKTLHQHDFSKSPRLDRVRDWFLLLCWTGSRFSDLSKIETARESADFISFRQKKTNNKVIIPLHPVVREILHKYNYTIPKPISNQRFNEYIKEVAQIAGLNSLESITRTEGGVRVTHQIEKWRLVSSHSGRRSFCTNMYLLGLPSLMIMSISGHKTEKAFLKYIKVTQKQHAEMMAERWKNLYPSVLSKE